jgi:signal transduction histidine kinase
VEGHTGLPASTPGAGSVLVGVFREHLDQAPPQDAPDLAQLQSAVLDALRGRVLVIDRHGTVRAANHSYRATWGGAPLERMPNFFDLLRELLPTLEVDEETVWAGIDALLAGTIDELDVEYSETAEHGTRRHVVDVRRIMTSPDFFLIVLADITDRRQEEVSRLHDQKLAAVGQLASGIAHEINTPIQFIGDNLEFLQTSFVPLTDLIDTYRSVLSTVALEDLQVERIAQAESSADIEFIAAELPSAIQQSLDGIDRVARIVKAMKAFGHPGSNDAQQAADINAMVHDVSIVARSQYRHVANLELDLGDVPPVRCFVGDINQVLLNLVVNASHAIADRPDTSRPGTLRISTCTAGDDVLIRVEDDGCGMTEEVRSRVFEPFFTTKEVGKGTGQGLPLSRSIVVDRHHGTIDCQSTPGLGTCFEVRLPLAGIESDDTR